MQKRKRFEEVKPRIGPPTGIDGAHERISAQIEDIINENPPWVPNVPSGSLDASQMIAWAYNSFVATASASDSSQGQLSHWLYGILCLGSGFPALQQALLALSVRQYGSKHHDQHVSNQGRRIYIRSLAQFQKALYAPELCMLDETLATACVMVLYEMTDPQIIDPGAWLGHVGGVAILLKARGPHRHRQPLSRRIFEQCRYMIMLQSIIRRKASIFAEAEWLLDPWQDATKDSEQQIIDHGLLLGRLLEYAEFFLRRQVCEDDDLSRFLEQCANVYQGVETAKSRAASASKAYADHHSSLIQLEEDVPLLITRIIAVSIQLAVCDCACRIVSEQEPFTALHHQKATGFAASRLCLSLETIHICTAILARRKAGYHIPKASRAIVCSQPLQVSILPTQI